MRPAYGYFPRRFWEVYDFRRQMYASPFDREWWSQMFYNPFIRFCLSHQIVRNWNRFPGEIAVFVRRPVREWCLKSVVDWSMGYPRDRKTRA